MDPKLWDVLHDLFDAGGGGPVVGYHTNNGITHHVLFVVRKGGGVFIYECGPNERYWVHTEWDGIGRSYSTEGTLSCIACLAEPPLCPDQVPFYYYASRPSDVGLTCLDCLSH